MQAFNIPEPDVKSFMNRLLKESLFDGFEVRGVEVFGITRFSLSGALDNSFVEANESGNDRAFCLWSELRPYVFQIIKGGKRPKAIRLIFSLDSVKAQSLHENAAALFLNIAYEGNSITCTTATSQKNFSLDKSMDMLWDENVINFFRENQIAVVKAE